MRRNLACAAILLAAGGAAARDAGLQPPGPEAAVLRRQVLGAEVLRVALLKALLAAVVAPAFRNCARL